MCDPLNVCLHFTTTVEEPLSHTTGISPCLSHFAFVLVNLNVFSLENCVDPDQLASSQLIRIRAVLDDVAFGPIVIDALIKKKTDSNFAYSLALQDNG